MDPFSALEEDTGCVENAVKWKKNKPPVCRLQIDLAIDWRKCFEERLEICCTDDDGESAGRVEDSVFIPPESPRWFNDGSGNLQMVAWSSHEVHLEPDKYSLDQADSIMRRIALEMLSCLVFGNNLMLEILRSEEFMCAMPADILASFEEQAARLTVHQEVYNKMLDFSDEFAYCRSDCFAELRMGRYRKLAEACKHDADVRTMLFFICACESVMFAPMLHCICYLAFTGFAPRLCKTNSKIMRDKYMHYKHARSLLAVCQRKIGRSKARNMTACFESTVVRLLEDIVGEYESPDGMYSYDLALSHVKHVFYVFRRENGLYESAVEEKAAHEMFMRSPVTWYACLPLHKVKDTLLSSEAGQRFKIPSFLDQDDAVRCTASLETRLEDLCYC